MKFYKYFEYAYLVIAAFFAFEAYNIWAESESRAYLFIFFTVLAIAMFFFKRNFRKRIEQRKNQ